MNSEKAICLKPGALIRMSLIVLHTNYTYIVPQETKAQQNQSTPAKSCWKACFVLSIPFIHCNKKNEVLEMHKRLPFFFLCYLGISRSSRSWDKGGGGGWPVSKKIFSALRASVWSKHKGGGPCPESAAARVSQIVSSSRLIFLKFLLLKKSTFSSDEAHQINPMTIVSLN